MDSLLARFGLEGQAWVDPVIGLIIFGIAILVSALSHYVIIPLAQRLSHHTETELDDLVFRAVRRPVSLIILVLGSYLAVVIPTDLTAGQRDVVNALFTAAAILAALVLITRLLSVSLDWYISRLSVDQRSATAHILPILRKVAVIIVYAIGVMLMLDALGISIGPLIASLSLGGLAVALAIQPTLSNVFAGTYVATENVISPGDYIELEGGIAGYCDRSQSAQHPHPHMGKPTGGYTQLAAGGVNRHKLQRADAADQRLSDLRRQLQQRSGPGGSSVQGCNDPCAGGEPARGERLRIIFRFRYLWRVQRGLLAVRAGQGPAVQLRAAL